MADCNLITDTSQRTDVCAESGVSSNYACVCPSHLPTSNKRDYRIDHCSDDHCSIKEYLYKMNYKVMKSDIHSK